MKRTKSGDNQSSEFIRDEKATSLAPIPLFVAGAARSGTSYTHNVLNAHPQIRMSYECSIITDSFYYYKRRRNLHDRSEFNKLLDKLYICGKQGWLSYDQWMLDVICKYRNELYSQHTQNPSLAGLIESIYMLPEPVRCWGNKILRVETCPQLIRYWPQAKIVILIRDPRAVCSSQTKYKPDRKFNLRLKYSAIYWNMHSAWTRSHATDKSQFLVIKYEDLVEEAYKEFSKILKLAGLWDAGILENMLAAHPPYRDGLYKWHSSLSEDKVRTVEGICFEEMKFWGYAPEIADKPKPIGSLSRCRETLLSYWGAIPLDIGWWRRKQLLRRFFEIFRGGN